MPNPSHKSFSVTTPGFWLLPYRMFLTVDGATPDSKPSERLFQRILHIRADFARKLLTSKKKYDIIYTFVILGRRQAVRHRTLTPAFAGSNPAVPAKNPGKKVPGIFYFGRGYGRGSPFSCKLIFSGRYDILLQKQRLCKRA